MGKLEVIVRNHQSFDNRHSIKEIDGILDIIKRYDASDNCATSEELLSPPFGDGQWRLSFYPYDENCDVSLFKVINERLTLHVLSVLCT